LGDAFLGDGCFFFCGDDLTSLGGDFMIDCGRSRFLSKFLPEGLETREVGDRESDMESIDDRNGDF